MFAYFQTYLRSLSKKDENRNGVQQRTSAQYQYYDVNQKLRGKSSQKSSGLDTDRTIRNSLQKTTFQHPNKQNNQVNQTYYSGLERNNNNLLANTRKQNITLNISNHNSNITNETISLQNQQQHQLQSQSSIKQRINKKYESINSKKKGKDQLKNNNNNLPQNKRNQVKAYQPSVYLNERQINNHDNLLTTRREGAQVFSPKLNQTPRDDGVFSVVRMNDEQNDLSVQNTEEDIYQKFLNQNQSSDKQPQNRQSVSLLQTIIQQPNDDDPRELHNAIQIYKESLNQSRQSRYHNNAPTPTYQNVGVSFNSSDYMRSVRTALKQESSKKATQDQQVKKANLYSKKYKSPRQQISNQKGQSSQQSSKLQTQSQMRNFESRDINLRDREMTYESERSSIFNENLSMVDSSNRNNFNNQYAHNLEEQKKAPTDISEVIYQLGDRIESARDVSRYNIIKPGSNNVVYQDASNLDNSKQIQQYLEMNLRMQSLQNLNDSFFSKNQFLRCVDLRNNQIKHLPDSLSNLNILWKLRLDFNLLEYLPNGIGKLERLEVLTASNNKLRELPKSLYQLQEKLGMLQLNDNLIKSLSNDIGKLKKLRVLLLHNNLFRKLPCELYYLKEIQEFSLEWFTYMNPPQNKILKDERGLLMIKDFQKFCKIYAEIKSRGSQQFSFVHFIAFFNQLSSLDQIQKMNSYPKYRSILHYLCLYGHLHLLKDVLRACPKINLNQIDQDGTSPLILAFKNKQNKVISFLLKFPALNLNKCSSKYGFPIHIGIKNHEFYIVQKMLKPEYVVNINAKDEDGNNSLHFLLGHFGYDSPNCGKIGALLLKKGIDINVLNKSEFSPLHMAIKAFQNKAIKFALEYNHYLRKKIQKDYCPFEHVMERRPSSVTPQERERSPVKQFNYEPFDFNIIGKNGWTLLHYAVFNNNLVAVELLLKAQKEESIYIFSRDHDGKYAQELCPFNSPIYKIILRRQNLIIRNMSISGGNNNNTGMFLNQTQSDKSNFASQQSRAITHNCINRFYIKRRMQNLHKSKSTKKIGMETIPFSHQYLKRANSNGMLLRQNLNNSHDVDLIKMEQRFEQMGSNKKVNNPNFGFMFLPYQNNQYSKNIAIDEKDKKLIRESIINQNSSEKNNSKARGLQNSQTEKNLFNPQMGFLSYNEIRSQGNINSSIEEEDEQSMRITKRLNDQQSPQIFQQIRKLPQQQPQYTKLDTELRLTEDIQKQETRAFRLLDKDNVKVENSIPSPGHTRYTSQVIDFNTENIENEDLNIYNTSQVSIDYDDENISDESDNSDSISQMENLMLNRSSSEQQQLNQSMNKHPNRHRKNKSSGQSSSRAIGDSSIIRRDQSSSSKMSGAIGVTGINLSSKQQSNQDEQEEVEDDEDDDICDAADEEAEAGALGLIANKINKFENQNVEIQENKVIEKEALKRFMIDMKAQRLIQKQNFQNQQIERRQSKQVITNILSAQTVDQPFNYIEKVEEDMNQYNTTLEDGNVFDTCENHDVSKAGDNSFLEEPSTNYYDNQKVSARNVKTRQNIFIVNDQSMTPKSLLQNQPFSRKSQVAQSNSKDNQNRALARLADLNKSCQLYDSNTPFSQKISVEDCLAILNCNSNTVGMSKKYQIFYQFIYQDGRVIDDKKLKQLYEKLEDNTVNSIFKVDLAYIISISKNKEFIPQLDSAIKQYNNQASQIKKLDFRQTNNKSPEPTLKSKQSDTNIQKALLTQRTHTRSNQFSQSNCKNLIIYETTNAFDILMNDAMVQSQNLMDQCNKKINIERERSRERMKLKHINSQSKLQNGSFEQIEQVYQNHTHRRYPSKNQKLVKLKIENFQEELNSITQNASEIPELMVRLNKSPSNQSIKNLKYYYNMYQDQNISIGNNTNKVNQTAINFQDFSNASDNNGNDQTKKGTFTPKGTSGQVFLAFQRQKQQSRLNHQTTDPQSPYSKNQNLDFTTQVPQYRVNLINEDENFNETIINSSIRPIQQIFEPLNHSRLQEDNNIIKPINIKVKQDASISQEQTDIQNHKFLSSNSLNSNNQVINDTSNFQNLIQSSQKDVQIQSSRDLKQSGNMNVYRNEPQNLKAHVSASGGSGSINPLHHAQSQKQLSAFSIKQRELSMQIKQNLSKKGINNNANATTNNVRGLQNAQSMINVRAVAGVENENSRKLNLNQSNNIVKYQVLQTQSSTYRQQQQHTQQQSSQQTRKPKIALNKLSPDKLTSNQDLSFEKAEERIKKNTTSNATASQIQYIKYSRRQMHQPQHSESQLKSINQPPAQLANISYNFGASAVKYHQGVKQVKYNLSIDSQNNFKNIKKSTSTTKLTSDTTQNQI
ncbi:leucine rich repeat family protein [Stylonychia lemnae]|uniref:Leucine rich repeat family protein n=1 Tax=Stylonychia lemnae TaxID=5949 RepID=A0A078ABT3_STYLE|nr:leucine rich repeat family protein [Stylonychia lemnae]|eukprot:CDW79052.1 leucine rich repeat family protein [Stylonychia lemnae]